MYRDKYLILWDVFEGKTHREPIFCSSDLVAVAYQLRIFSEILSDHFRYSPTGKEICTSSIDGQLTFWDAESK